MMKIAVLGAKGYIGQHLVQRLDGLGEVYPVTREQVDLLDAKRVRRYLHRHQFDVVVGAAKHPEWELAPRPDIASHNLTLFTNVWSAREHFGRYINLGSGAEFDRTRDMVQAEPQDLFQHCPLDGYGLSRNIISRVCSHTPNFYTLRLWGVFGNNEPDFKLFQRVRRGAVRTAINDCRFDYISLQDLGTVVQHYCTTVNPEHKDINVVYWDKLRLTEQLELFCELQGIAPNWTVSNQPGLDYTGWGGPLSTLKLNLQGLRAGLEAYQ